jgi:hypothetical protein
MAACQTEPEAAVILVDTSVRIDLRGGIHASLNKDYVLVLLFVKYVSTSPVSRETGIRTHKRDSKMRPNGSSLRAQSLA